jgi:hypothetical protein
MLAASTARTLPSYTFEMPFSSTFAINGLQFPALRRTRLVYKNRIRPVLKKVKEKNRLILAEKGGIIYKII